VLCSKLAALEVVLSLVGDTVKVFGAYSVSVPSKWSHMDGAPWSYVINELHDRNGAISDDLISDYFERNAWKYMPVTLARVMDAYVPCRTL
jgi:hypothetical protein